MYHGKLNVGLAQLVERQLPKLNVAISNLVLHSMLPFISISLIRLNSHADFQSDLIMRDFALYNMTASADHFEPL